MILAIVQARMGSSRLPGKVLLPAAGKPLLQHLLERLSNCRLIDKIIVATSNSSVDDKLADELKSWGYEFFRGLENDVLDRFYRAWKSSPPAETVVRITGDCPLIDPEVTDKVIKRFVETGVDYLATATSWPDGLDTEVFRGQVLQQAWKEAELPSEREHVTPYLKNHPQWFKTAEVRCYKDLSAQRWTLDEERDYQLIKAVYEGLYHSKRLFLMQDILDFLDKHPGLSAINKGIIRRI